MLPPGIYLWESGVDDLAEPIDVVSFQDVHPNFTQGCIANASWEEVIEVQGVGTFRKCNYKTESVVVMIGGCRTTMEVARFLATRSVLPKWGR